MDTSKVSLDPAKKEMINQAAMQLEMLIAVFNNGAPERVQKAAIELRDSLKEWANG